MSCSWDFGEELWGLKHSWGQLNKLRGLSRGGFEEVGVERGLDVPIILAFGHFGVEGLISIFSW